MRLYQFLQWDYFKCAFVYENPLGKTIVTSLLFCQSLSLAQLQLHQQQTQSSKRTGTANNNVMQTQEFPQMRGREPFPLWNLEMRGKGKRKEGFEERHACAIDWIPLRERANETVICPRQSAHDSCLSLSSGCMQSKRQINMRKLGFINCDFFSQCHFC